MLRSDYKRKRRDIAAGKVIKVYSASSRPYKKRRVGGAAAGARPSRYGGKGGETKYVDGYLDATTIHELANNDDTWADTEVNPRQVSAVYGCLPVPRQGTNYADRDGRRIYIKKITINGSVTWPTNDTLTAGVGLAPVRLVVVKDTRTNGTEVSGENVIGPGLGSDGAAALTSDAQLYVGSNPDGWGRYKIVESKIIRVPSSMTSYHDGTDAGLNGITVPFSFSVKANCSVQLNASTGAVGSIIDNSFHLLAACHVTTTTTPALSYVARTSFTG